MPPEVAQGSLVDMEAIRDKEMREKFVSSQGPGVDGA